MARVNHGVLILESTCRANLVCSAHMDCLYQEGILVLHGLITSFLISYTSSFTSLPLHFHLLRKVHSIQEICHLLWDSCSGRVNLTMYMWPQNHQWVIILSL